MFEREREREIQEYIDVVNENINRADVVLNYAVYGETK